MKYILGKKLGMTTIYNDDGAQNVTLVECEPNSVHVVRNEEKDGYSAVGLSVDKTRKRKHVKEFRTESADAPAVGEMISVSTFDVGERVNVYGVSKGKGFQGVVKRHGFAGSPATHGHRHDLRAPGSIGSAFPQHVIKGKKMAGRMGAERVCTRNLIVVAIDEEAQTIALRGAVPGVSGRIVEIVSTA